MAPPLGLPRGRGPQIDFISLSLLLEGASCFLTVLLDSLQSLSPPEGKDHPNKKECRGRTAQELPFPVLLLLALSPRRFLSPPRWCVFVLCACVLGSERRGGRQRGNEENKDRGWVKECVCVLYVCACVCLKASAAFIHDYVSLHDTACCKLVTKEPLSNNRCWPIVVVSSNSVYCNQWFGPSTHCTAGSGQMRPLQRK